jgi:FkbM family methyltransferase
VHSQNEEERYVLAACSEPTGRFLDIGAWNAIDKSNTRALFERGWTGVLVEPSPGPYRGIRAAYRGVEGMTVINAAVVIEPGPVEMWLTDDCCSTTDWATWRKWKRLVAFQPIKSVIAGITLEEIFQQHGEFAVASIDTEGTSVDIMFRLLALGRRPQCICVEHDDRQGEILSRVTALGYVCTYGSGENMVLVKS